jgi:Ca2+:H+ antiporter
MKWLVVFVPVAAALNYLAPDRHLLIFVASGIAIIPLAGWMGHATEHLATRFGEGIGGLLNATFGNAAELIIAIAALRAGLHEVVKASLAGAIIGNVLLVLGASMLAGGIGRTEQKYNAAAARSQATMLTLAVIALIVPAALRATSGVAEGSVGTLSVLVSVTLLGGYALNLLFSLGTHRTLFEGEGHAPEAEHGAAWSVKRSALVLAGSTAAIAWMSEILVHAIKPAGEALGLNDVFVGVFVVAVLGNAAEHFSAITAARKDRMDLSLSIAIGSSVQVALFVAPLLVLLSYAMGPRPMDLAFPGGLILSILLSTLITGQVSGDGRSDWLRGAQLLAVYLMLGLGFFFVPS